MCEHCQTSLPICHGEASWQGPLRCLLRALCLSPRARADQPVSSEPAPNAIPPSEALDRLMQGNARYVAGECECKDYSVGRAARADVQYPIAAVLSCSDSRVSPELLFDQGPGEIFVVRLAGNFLNDEAWRAWNMPFKFLGAPLVMVLGHTNCGAIAAAVKVVKERIELAGPSA